MLRLGIIGVSPGNGHPFSWAAICNGYDAAAMAASPYPAIAAYLGERRFPEDRLELARVTHVWTQDPATSRAIAAASLIPSISASPEAMIGAVDAILLARDDAESHARFALPYLEAGLPVYIDKPFALSLDAARALLAAERYPGQIFTGSALAYARELRPSAEALADLGEIKRVIGATPKAWDTYAVHVIEPVLALLDRGVPSTMRLFADGDDARHVLARWRGGPSALFSTLGKVAGPIRIDLFGTRAHLALTFNDSFSAFREALRRFCVGAIEKRRMFDRDRLLAVTEIIEKGRVTG